MVNKRMRRVGFGLPVLAVLFVLAVGPAWADTSIVEAGQPGAHHLIDTTHKPGVLCEYNERTGHGYYYEGLLRHIQVRAPYMRAFEGVQNVWWRFIVHRIRRDGANPPTQKVTHRSHWQMGSASQTEGPGFHPMGIGVRVPMDGRDGSVGYGYLIEVQMRWYEGAHVTGMSKHEADNYGSLLNGHPTNSKGSVFGNDCFGWLGIES